MDFLISRLFPRTYFLSRIALPPYDDCTWYFLPFVIKEFITYVNCRSKLETYLNGLTHGKTQ